MAEIPLNKAYEKKIVGSTDNSDIAEAFRILRTNMSYLSVVREKGSKSERPRLQNKSVHFAWEGCKKQRLTSLSRHQKVLLKYDVENERFVWEGLQKPHIR